jgi:hypothetical protein
MVKFPREWQGRITRLNRGFNPKRATRLGFSAIRENSCGKTTLGRAFGTTPETNGPERGGRRFVFSPRRAYIRKLRTVVVPAFGDAHQWAQAHFFVAGNFAGGWEVVSYWIHGT